MATLHRPPRAATLWPTLRDRIATARMATILGGTGRVVLEGDYTGVPWAETEAGGRVVLVPVLNLGGFGGPYWRPGEMVQLAFLVRCDFNPFPAAGYDVTVAMEAAQAEAFARLQWWKPAPDAAVTVATPIRCERPWQPRGLWDEESGTVYLSSEYRVDVAAT